MLSQPSSSALPTAAYTGKRHRQAGRCAGKAARREEPAALGSRQAARCTAAAPALARCKQE